MPTKPVAVMVLFLTPGPLTVKLWMSDLSRTMNTYFPCLSVATFLPAFLSEIVKPGPIVPARSGAAIVAAAATPATIRAAAAARARKRMGASFPVGGLPPPWTLLQPSPETGGSRGCTGAITVARVCGMCQTLRSADRRRRLNLGLETTRPQRRCPRARRLPAIVTGNSLAHTEADIVAASRLACD